MGFPGSFHIPVADTQAYQQFGNSVVVRSWKRSPDTWSLTWGSSRGPWTSRLGQGAAPVGAGRRLMGSQAFPCGLSPPRRLAERVSAHASIWGRSHSFALLDPGS